MLLRPHRSLRCAHRIITTDSRKSSKRNCKLPRSQVPKPCDLKTDSAPKSDSRSMASELFTADWINSYHGSRGNNDRRNPAAEHRRLLVCHRSRVRQNEKPPTVSCRGASLSISKL